MPEGRKWRVEKRGHGDGRFLARRRLGRGFLLRSVLGFVRLLFLGRLVGLRRFDHERVLSRPGVSDPLQQRVGFLVAEGLDHADGIGVAALRRDFAQLDQKLLDVLQLQIVGPEQQAVLHDVGVDAELVGTRGRPFLRAGVEVEGRIIAPVAALGLLFLAAQEHHLNGASDVVGLEPAQRDHLEAPAAAVELFDQGADRHVVGQRGVGDDRPIPPIHLQPRVYVEIADLLEGLHERLRVHARQVVDVHPFQGGLERPAGVRRDVDRPDRLFDDGQFVRRRVGDDAVILVIGHEIDFRLARWLAPGRLAPLLLLLLLLLLGHHLGLLLGLLHFLRRHRAPG
ncbi:MAG: hypothetical protein NTW96_22305 [Planctomycetia bacterium]|nr:hypothetical protein [Planctomycetia bacterium]